MKDAMATWAKDRTASNRAAAVAVTKKHHHRCNRATPVGKSPPNASSIFGDLMRSYTGKKKELNAKSNARNNARNNAKNNAKIKEARQARLQESLLANTDEGKAMSMERTRELAGSVFANMVEQIPGRRSLASLRKSCVGVSNASHVHERTRSYRYDDEDWECTGAMGTRYGRILPYHSHNRMEVMQMEEALIDLMVEAVGWPKLKNTNRQVCVRVC